MTNVPSTRLETPADRAKRERQAQGATEFVEDEAVLLSFINMTDRAMKREVAPPTCTPPDAD